MDTSSLFARFRDAFLGGVYTETFRDRDNGGPECAEYMSIKFRIITSFFMVRFN